MRRPSRWRLAWLAGALAAGCTGASGKVLERRDGATPTGARLRMDVFVVRSAVTCAIGPACPSQDASECFTLSDAAGPRIGFDPGQVQFVASDDTRIGSAPQSACFRLGLDAAQVTRIETLTQQFRSNVFRDSGGDIDLDVRLHDVPAVDVPFARFVGGALLTAAAIAGVVRPAINRETDFVYIVTGWSDPETGIYPTMNECAGTGRASQSSVGAGFSWIGLSEGCIQRAPFLSTFMIQLSFGMREVLGFRDLYDSDYPACGDADPDTRRWFPRPGDCTSDPDAPTCGGASCPDIDEFYVHVLSKHWPHGVAFTGNHCENGRADADETGVDAGGVCALLGR